LGDFERTRLSVILLDVVEGREAEFHSLARQFQDLIKMKGYGHAELVGDEADARRFYSVRYWTEAAAAERCHADADVRAVTTRIHEIASVSHVVNGARRLREREKETDLVGAARRAREHADAAFSKFKVGAALLTADGTVITGCNIENATYGLTICAERVAMFKALSEGHRAFTRMAIVADTQAPTPPCGACRQVLWEFGGDIDIVLANLTDDKGTHRLKDLLPLPFDARLL
jgi:cytidine deaminase